MDAAFAFAYICLDAFAYGCLEGLRSPQCGQSKAFLDTFPLHVLQLISAEPES